MKTAARILVGFLVVDFSALLAYVAVELPEPPPFLLRVGGWVFFVGLGVFVAGLMVREELP